METENDAFGKHLPLGDELSSLRNLIRVNAPYLQSDYSYIYT